MKYLIKITFNVLIDQKHQTVEHYCSSYMNDDNELKLFDDNKQLLCCFKKAHLLNIEIEDLNPNEPESTPKKKKKAA